MAAYRPPPRPGPCHLIRARIAGRGSGSGATGHRRFPQNRGPSRLGTSLALVPLGRFEIVSLNRETHHRPPGAVPRATIQSTLAAASGDAIQPAPGSSDSLWVGTGPRLHGAGDILDDPPTMWSFAWQNLITRPTRTALAVVGLTIPVLAFLGLFSLSRGDPRPDGRHARQDAGPDGPARELAEPGLQRPARRTWRRPCGRSRACASWRRRSGRSPRRSTAGAASGAAALGMLTRPRERG